MEASMRSIFLAYYTIYGEGELTLAGDGTLKIQNRAADLREAAAAITAEGKVAVEGVQLQITGGNGGHQQPIWLFTTGKEQRGRGQSK